MTGAAVSEQRAAAPLAARARRRRRPTAPGVDLRGDDQRIDVALGALYDRRRPAGGAPAASGGLARSAPAVARWLGDIRRYFPTPVVQVLQRDAVERLDLHQLLLEPELLDELEPDLHLVTLLVELNRALPDETRATARQVIGTVLAAARGAPRRPHPPGRARRARPGQPHRPARARPTSTGRARSTPTCATGCPSTARSCPSTSSGSAATSAASPATSSSPSTRAARWPAASSTPRCSRACWPGCPRCARRWSCSTRRSPT